MTPPKRVIMPAAEGASRSGHEDGGDVAVAGCRAWCPAVILGPSAFLRGQIPDRPGFSRQNERLRKPSARSFGHTWARSATRESCGRVKWMAPELRKRQAGYTAGTREVDQRYMRPWARGEPVPGERTDSGQIAAGTGGAVHRSLSEPPGRHGDFRTPVDGFQQCSGSLPWWLSRSSRHSQSASTDGTAAGAT